MIPVTSPETSLRLISRANYLPSIAEAWDSGSNIRACLKADSEATKAAICSLILDVVSFIDAKKTLTKASEIAFTAEAIIEDFPTLKIEELKLVAHKMKKGAYGTYFERLKTPEFMEAIKRQEEERAEYMETKHKKRIKEIEVETASLSSQAFSFREIADKLNLPRPGAKNLRDFMREGAVLTPQEMKEIEDEQAKQQATNTSR